MPDFNCLKGKSNITQLNHTQNASANALTINEKNVILKENQVAIAFRLN